MKVRLRFSKVDGKSVYDSKTITFNADFDKTWTGIVQGVKTKVGVDLNAVRKNNLKKSGK